MIGDKKVTITTTLSNSVASRLEDEGYVKVRCRLCGEPWLYPPEMAKQFDSNHGLECSYCRRNARRY